MNAAVDIAQSPVFGKLFSAHLGPIIERQSITLNCKSAINYSASNLVWARLHSGCPSTCISTRRGKVVQVVKPCVEV